MTVPTIRDLLLVRSGDPTIIQEIHRRSISLTVYHVRSLDYLNDIHFGIVSRSPILG